MRFLFLALPLLLFACGGKPVVSENISPSPTGYGYTERNYAASAESVKKGVVALLQDFIRESVPAVPGTLEESANSFGTGWIYAKEQGAAVRRKYHVSFVSSENGTMVILSMEEARKIHRGGSWHSIVPANAVYHSFFSRLHQKIQKLR